MMHSALGRSPVPEARLGAAAGTHTLGGCSCRGPRDTRVPPRKLLEACFFRPSKKVTADRPWIAVPSMRSSPPAAKSPRIKIAEAPQFPLSVCSSEKESMLH